ncbi:MAG: peptide-methionine (R)-S-oxide reductase MsrB [Patescibacteria group bacterium]
MIKDTLTDEQKQIMFEKGTEAPFSGKYVNEHADGMYKCSNCGNVLFSSDTKFDSGTGWPSFTEPENFEHIELIPDNDRTEVKCKNCGAHLGHVFNDGPNGKQRFCINSVCLELEPK